MAKLTPEELAPYIKSCGFYATKSKNIIATCRILADKYDGKVPEDRDELQTLPGVGRKTANVVVSNAFGQDAIAVDTHVFRVANRLGLVHAKDAKKTEEQLMEHIPQEQWSIAVSYTHLQSNALLIKTVQSCDAMVQKVEETLWQH